MNAEKNSYIENHPTLQGDGAQEGSIIAKPHHVCEFSPDGQPLSRRNFLKLGLGALSALAVLEAGGASMMFLQSQGHEGKLGGVVTAGPVDSFQPGSVVEFPDARFFLVRSYDGGFLAIHSRCPHLGCTVVWQPEENKFLCPCHAAHFDFHGDFEAPPVPRPLDTFAVSIDDGMVNVDTARISQRERYSPDQLTSA